VAPAGLSAYAINARSTGNSVKSRHATTGKNRRRTGRRLANPKARDATKTGLVSRTIPAGHPPFSSPQPSKAVGFIGISPLHSCCCARQHIAQLAPASPLQWPPPPRDPSSDPAPPRPSAPRRPGLLPVSGRPRCRGDCPPLLPASS
jgi:hypothetical protein